MFELDHILDRFFIFREFQIDTNVGINLRNLELPY